MIEFIIHLVIGSLFVWGVFKIFDDLLLPVRVKIETWLGPKWSKPMVTCPPCMASFHGIYLGLIFFGADWIIILYCVSLCGLNYLIQQFLPEYD
jgi:hypothetical protein